MRGLSLAIALALALIAGFAAAAELPVAKINAIKEGKTTKAEVQLSLGEPEYTNHNPDGRSALMYSYILPPTAKGKPATGVTVGLVFDAKDVLLAKRFYTGPAPEEEAPVGPLPPKLIDPLDSVAMRRMEWATFDQSPIWLHAALVDPKDQVLEVFPFGAVRKTKSEVDGNAANLTLNVARDGSKRLRLDLGFDMRSLKDCGVLRDKFNLAYGAPSAVRQTTTRSPIGASALIYGHDLSQWRADATTITLDCSSIGIENSRSIYTARIELEPAATAAPLEPLVSLTCPGLDLGGKTGANSMPPTLVFDTRDEVVRGPNRFLARLRASVGAFGFNLSPHAAVQIDRSTGGYSVETDRASDRSTGVCLVVDAAT